MSIREGAATSTAGAGQLAISVVVPCFNEENAIADVVGSLLEVVPLLTDSYEVVVVDDGSTDRSAAIVRVIAGERPHVRLLGHSANRGYGAALRTGFDAARHEWLFFVDGDGQFDAADLGRLVSLVPRFDVVTGYRERRRDSVARLLCGMAWTSLTNRVLGARVRDVNCAFKLFPRSLLERARLESEGALVPAELLSEARRLGYSIGEVGVSHHPRRSGRATGVAPSVVAKAVIELGRVWSRRR